MTYTEDDDMPLIGTTPPGPHTKKKDSLTFGIEIEFAVAAIRTGVPDPHPEDGRAVLGLLDGLHKPSVSGWIKNAIRHIGIALNEAGISVEKTEPKSAPRNQQAWGITIDESICAPENKLYDWVPIEINSPAYYYSETSAERALDEIKIVCETLTSKFRISCNWSSGLHVHVGNGNNGFLFETVRNLMATIWTFEPQFEEIHPQHRRDNPNFCPGYREGSVLGLQKHLRRERNSMRKFQGTTVVDEMGFEKDEDSLCTHGGEPISLLDGNRYDLEPDVKDGLERLLKAESIDEIIYLSRTHDRTASANGGWKIAYHLGDVEFRLDGTGNGSHDKRTIEFRQHRSTLDFEAVENWVKFCVLLVNFADVVEDEVLERWLRQHIGDFPDEYPLGRVLEKMGMPWLAFWYPLKIAEVRMKRVPVSQEQVLYNIIRELQRTWNAEQEGLLGGV